MFMKVIFYDVSTVSKGFTASLIEIAIALSQQNSWQSIVFQKQFYWYEQL